MKRGTEYAKRIKHLHQQMLKKLGKPQLPEPSDPIHQLMVGILAENASEHKASALFQRICEQMVDLNELRVTPPLELAEMIGTTVSQARDKADRLIRVLNEIRIRQDALDLSFLKQRGRREAREYLESLEGVSLYAAASVIAHSLGGHAIPVDFLTIYVLRKEDAVDDSADVSTVQSFLERHVPAAESRGFAMLLSKYVSTEGARVQVNRLPELLNLAPPPPLKPWRKPGMDKPGLPLPTDGDSIPELEGVPIDDDLLAGEGSEQAAQEADEKVHKPAPAKKSKKAEPEQPKAAKMSKPAKAKHTEKAKVKSKPQTAVKKKK